MLWDCGYCAFRKESIVTLLKHDVKSKVVSVRTLHKLIITGKVRLKNQYEILYLVLLFIAIGHVYISGYTVTKTVKYLFSFKPGDIFSHSIALVIISSESAFKIGLLPSKEIWFICLNENLLSMKSAFYIILKALFRLKIFKFLS